LQEIPADYKELEEKVQAYAEGMVGGGWLWVCLIDPLAPDIPILSWGCRRRGDLLGHVELGW
jgi:hypothetical protein